MIGAPNLGEAPREDVDGRPTGGEQFWHARGLTQRKNLTALVPHSSQRHIQVAQFLLDLGGDCLALALERLDVQLLELALQEPAGHRVGVVADYGETQAVGLEQRCPAPHERVEHDAVEIVAPEVVLSERRIDKLRQCKAPKQRPRPPGKPLVDRNDRSIALLNLLLGGCERGHQRFIEARLHAWRPTNGPARTAWDPACGCAEGGASGAAAYSHAAARMGAQNVSCSWTAGDESALIIGTYVPIE